MKGTQGSIARRIQLEEEARLHPEMGGQNLEVLWVGFLVVGAQSQNMCPPLPYLLELT